jgi:vacuolar-type H+-ATPase subunit H
MDNQLFITAVAEMRKLQKDYFDAARKGFSSAARGILPHAKDAEGKVDRMLQELTGQETKNQIKMF